VYASSDFSGPISISEITFYNHNVVGPLSPENGIYTISLSTTSAPVNGLSSNMDDKIGADDVKLFTGKLPALAPGPGGELDFFLRKSFFYDPQDGNLLLNVVSHNASDADLPLSLDTANFSGLFSRAYANGDPRNALMDPGGLVTGLNTVSPVPVPSVGAGLPGLLALGSLLVWWGTPSSIRMNLACSPEVPDTRLGPARVELIASALVMIASRSVRSGVRMLASTSVNVARRILTAKWESVPGDAKA
jgi:hypothetical protein